MTTLAREAIAVLLDLAQRGEIDPWDVQVIEVIDRYLSKIGPMEDPNTERSPADLPQSGQAFLWASMLVLLKANTLEQTENDEEQAEIEDFVLQEVEGSGRTLPVRLEHHIRRRPTAPPPRSRRVTLAELIEQIQQMAAILESSPSPSKMGPSLQRSRQETARAIAQLAHDENLSEVAAQLEQFLAIQLPQLMPAPPSSSLEESVFVELEQLLEWWAQANSSPEVFTSVPNDPKSKDRVGVFWALLLLSAQSKVELYQEEFYQDLKIRPIDGQAPIK
jgi:segregation and condensation protein A